MNNKTSTTNSTGKSTGVKVAIAAMVAGVGAIVVILVVAMKKPKGITTTTTTPGGTTTTTGGYKAGNVSSGNTYTGSNNSSTPAVAAAPAVNQFPLEMGSRDSGYGAVSRLQNALNGLGQNITADGIFGSQTQAALQAVTGTTTVNSEAALEAIEARQYPGAATGAPYTIDYGLGIGQPIDTTTTPAPAPPAQDWLSSVTGGYL